MFFPSEEVLCPSEDFSLPSSDVFFISDVGKNTFQGVDIGVVGFTGLVSVNLCVYGSSTDED